MRRRFLLAAVAAAIPIAGSLVSGLHGCSSDAPFESVCLWVADPDNCYRRFREDMEDNHHDCVPPGNPTPVFSDPKNPNGVSNGAFQDPVGMPLTVCFINSGGTVTFDPPIDLTMFPPGPLAAATTYKMTIVDASGTECGVASYTSPHGFSFTIDAPADGGAGGGSSGAGGSGITLVDAGDGGVPPMPYGSYTQTILPGRDAFDVTCPSGESHHLNLDEATSVYADSDGGPATSCPEFAGLVPQAVFSLNPPGLGVAGAVSFSIVWPPATGNYPPWDAGVAPVQGQLVTYVNCAIDPGGSGVSPGLPPQCMDMAQNGTETDVDCGGPEKSCGCPARCGAGLKCKTDCDCDATLGLVCEPVMGVLQCALFSDAGTNPPTDPACAKDILCQDGVKDGDETDVDCGGCCVTQGKTCAIGQKCMANTDCGNGVCFQNKCAPGDHCTDTTQDYGETDVDCGGTCDAQGLTCALGQKCAVAADCMTNVCTSGKCTAKDCSTGCGVGCPGKPCQVLQPCATNADCMTNACLPVDGGLLCVEPSCTDMVKDGAETDVDCGGSSCPACPDGNMCAKDSDCQNMICGPATQISPGQSMSTVVNKCFPTSCLGDAGKPICGGGTCQLCVDGDACTSNADCLFNGCVPTQNDAGPAAVCAAPTCTDGVQDGSETDKDCGGSGGCPKCAPGQKCLVNSDCQTDPANLDAGPTCLMIGSSLICQ